MMKKLIVLLLLAYGSAQATPVSLSFEAFSWFTDINYGDNVEERITAWTRDNCNSVNGPLHYSDPCFYHSRSNTRFGGWGDAWGGGTSELNWDVQTNITSSDNFFSVESSIFVSAEAAVPAVPPPGAMDIEQSIAYAANKVYWLEFVVSERVIYSGSEPLTDGLFDLSDFYTQTFGETGNLYLPGDILEPGIYQFWDGCNDCVTAGPSDLPRTEYLRAFQGETLYSSAEKDFEFHFTVVPIPPAAYFFMSALLGLAWFRGAKA